MTDDETRRIEPRKGVEVYLSKAGYVCISQEDDDHVKRESVIVLEPSMVPKVVEFLKDALDEYLEDVKAKNAADRQTDAP